MANIVESVMEDRANREAVILVKAKLESIKDWIDSEVETYNLCQKEFAELERKLTMCHTRIIMQKKVRELMDMAENQPKLQES